MSSPGDLAASAPGAHSELAVEVVEEFLASTPLFSRCDPAAVVRAAPQILAFSFPAGTTIVAAGEQTGWLGILFSGRATVRSVDAATGTPSVLETLRVGDHFGDIGALLGSGQPFAVVAEEDVTLLEVPGDLVDQFARTQAGFGTALARRLSTRLLQASVQTVRRSTVAPPPPPATEPARSQTPAPPVAPTPPASAPVIPFVQASDYAIGPSVLAMIPARLIQRHQVLPLEVRGNRLTVGMVNPRNPAAVGDLQRVLRSVQPDVVAISANDFAQTVARFKIAEAASAELRHPSDTGMPALSVSIEPVETWAPSAETALVDGADAEQLARRVLLAALEREATAIHLEPEAGGLKVRFRADGVLADWGEFIPPSAAGPLMARLEDLAGIGGPGPRGPREGRLVLRAGPREIDVALATLPSSRAVAAVLRLFDASSMSRPLDQIFLEPEIEATVRRALERPDGAVLVAGPATSGRSSTLYSLISERRRSQPGAAVRTVEDPVKVHLRGVGQSQAGPLGDPSVATLLRATLRLDPDVVMVGELRDPETAALALEAATTGHLVLSALHARTALAALQRLLSLGVERAIVAQGVELIVAQRLARRLCAACVKSSPPAPAVAEALVGCGLADPSPDGPSPMPSPVGCEVCQGNGHLGRVAIVETLRVTDEVRAAIAAGAPLSEIERLAVVSSALSSFRRAARFFLSRQLIDPSEALLVVAE